MAKKVIKRKTASRGTQKRVRGLDAKIRLAESTINRAQLPDYSSGDTVRVHVRIKEGDKERVQAFEGVVIAKRNRDAGKSFTVRKVSHGVGVERIFLEASPKIAKLEVVQAGKVRRSKLYYLRGLEGRAARIEREADAVSAPVAANGTK